MLTSTILAVIVFFKFSNGIETCDGGYCFSYDGNSMDLVGAHIYCQNQNKYLLEIKNQEFQSLVTKTITNWFSANKANFVSVQIWLNTYPEQGNYHWKSNSEIITYFNWDHNQPDIGSVAIKLICSRTDCKWIGTSDISTIGVVICYNENNSNFAASTTSTTTSKSTTLTTSTTTTSSTTTTTATTTYLGSDKPSSQVVPQEKNSTSASASSVGLGVGLFFAIFIIVVIVFGILLWLLKKQKLNCLKSKPTSTISAPTTSGNESVWNQRHNENNTYDHLKSVDENNHTYGKLNNSNINININNNNNNNNNNISNINDINNNNNNYINIDSTYDHLQKVAVDDSYTYDKLNKMK